MTPRRWWKISGRIPQAKLSLMEARTQAILARMAAVTTIMAIWNDTTIMIITWGRTATPALPRKFILQFISRKSASVQIIAHEPSRCEGCFDGRLPLLLIVVFIALVLFLLCIGVILDAEGNNFYGWTAKFTFGSSSTDLQTKLLLSSLFFD